MYGQKTGFGVMSAGISLASWWMLGVTVMLATIAVILLVRVFITIHSRDTSRRP